MTKIRIAVQLWYEKTKVRKGLQSFGCLLILGALFDGSSCDQNKGGVRPRATVTNMPVKIKDCEPETGKDPITVHKGFPVDWLATDDTYVIHFEPKYYPGTTNPITVPSDQQLPKGATTSQPLSLPDNCAKKGCYFKYDILDSTGKICNDPGVHVIPTGGGGVANN